MAKRLFLLSGLIALVIAVVAPVAQSTTEGLGEGHGTTAVDVASMRATTQLADPPPGGWPVPNARSYHLLSSCAPHAAAIRQGAAAWQGLTEGGGTPVECRNDYIRDCGGGGNVVGCNWGAGQRIALFMGGVNDDALLAAHEFGHDWFGHSNFRCAGWGSPEEVMAPSICNLAGTTTIDQ